MSRSSTARVRVGIKVTRHDSKWIPFTYEMFHIRQRSSEGLTDWASESVGLLSVLGSMPGQQRMKVDETRRFFAQVELSYWQDYWGECDQDIVILSWRRVK
ncbi:hypothetical protein [Curvibacter phage PCA1]|nr:hypothetical protein [Curvibacter phage PCA1]